jgi:hypothetical protein
MNLNIYSISILLVLSNLFIWTKACGITTHTVIGHRAASHFDYFLENTTSISAVRNQ